MVHREINDIELPYYLWKNVKPIKTVKSNLALDTETLKTGECFLISDSNGLKADYKNNFGLQTDNILEGLLTFLNNREYSKTVNWFYNLEFDTNAILAYLPFEKRKLIANYNQVDYEGFRISIIPKKELQIARLDKNKKPKNPTFFYDLAQFYEFIPLKKLAQQTNYKKVYVEDISNVDIKKYQNDKEYNKLWQDRCVIDCKITVELADKFTLRINPIVNLHKYKSKASIARRYVLENLNHNLKMPNIHVLDASLKAFHAGHIETCVLGTVKNVKYYDINCFDTETELLTEKGFKKWNEFTQKDKAASLNLNTGYIEYQDILHIQKHWYTGNLLHQKNENLDIMATPNHRIYYQVHNRCKNAKHPEEYNTWSGYKVSIFQDTPKGNIRIPTNGIHLEGIKPNIDKDWIKLCGWVITEGHFSKEGNGITIYQSDKYNYHKEIRKILKDTDIKYTERDRGIRPNKNYSSHEFYIWACDGRYIRDSLNDKKEIPKEWVLKWDKESLEILFWELMKGDGSFKCQKGKADFKSFNDHDLNMMNLMAFKIGYKSSINYKNHTLHIKLNRDGNYACVQNTQVRNLVPYDDMVWCVTVPNDTLVVRRNGKIFITGNSAYPTQIANLYETNEGYLHNKEYEPDTAYSFYLVEVDYEDNNLSPLWYLNKSNNYHVTGKCETWITQSEYEFYHNNGYPIKIIKAYHIKKNRYTEKPFEFLVKDLYNLRTEAKKDNDPIELVYKIILNSIYGVTMNANLKRVISEFETDLYENIDGYLIYYLEKYMAGNMYNPVYGTFITAKTRMQLFTDFKDKINKVLSVNTDGVYLSSKTNVPISKKLGDYSYDKIPEIMIMGSGRYFIKDNQGAVDDKKSRFRSIPKTPSQIHEDMLQRPDEMILKTTKDKPIKLKESTRIGKYKDKLNVFRPVVKKVSFKTDRRHWFDEVMNMGALQDNIFESRPYNVNEL